MVSYWVPLPYLEKIIDDIVTFPYNSLGLNFFTLESILLSLGRYIPLLWE